MRIGEVSQQTGLTVSNIRFYEKKGLILPDRKQQSRYRDYTDEDVRRLKLIVLYRKMNFSLEAIEKLAAAEQSPDAALKNQLESLREEQRRLQGSVDLCEKLAADFASGAARVKNGQGLWQQEMDVDQYLHYVKREEESGHSFAKVEELLEDFAEYARYDRIMLFSGLYGWLALHPRINRVLAAVWCLFWVLFPLYAIADACRSGKGLSAGAAVFWGAWLVFTAVSVAGFFAARSRKRGEDGSD